MNLIIFLIKKLFCQISHFCISKQQDWTPSIRIQFCRNSLIYSASNPLFHFLIPAAAIPSSIYSWFLKPLSVLRSRFPTKKSWVVAYFFNFFQLFQKKNIYVVVGISNSVLSILTANFPVRIGKKSLYDCFKPNWNVFS